MRLGQWTKPPRHSPLQWAPVEWLPEMTDEEREALLWKLKRSKSRKT